MRFPEARWQGGPHEALVYAGYSGRCHSMPEAHWHSEIEMGFIVEGAVEMAYGAEIRSLSSGCLNLFWGILPHQVISAKQPLRSYVSLIPLHWFLSESFPWCGKLVSDLDALHLTIPPEEQEWVESCFRRWAEDYLAFRGCQNAGQRAAYVELFHAEIKAFLMRLALVKASVASTPLLESASWLLVALREIHACFHEDLSVSVLAGRSGLNPQYFSREFKKRIGMGVNAYITKERLRHAKRLLATTNGKVADIAFASGFGNLGRFNEAFRQCTGSTPREFRVRSRTAASC
jgi:AraC-like DNA-binding protein